MTGKPLALVTGGSTGIGYALAQQCLRHGLSVLMQVPVAAGRWGRSLALGRKCFSLNIARKGKHLLADLVN
jgi:NAD(P)-dependent dehydrogenase (short-subunit alcohol dehydrogenase family)